MPVQIVTGPTAEAPEGGRVRTTVAAAETAPGLMPDLRGSTLRQALTALTPRGVRVEIAGRGRVVQQAPAPGELLDDESVARLVLSRSIVRVAQRGGAEVAREAVQ
jgi:beta-lactam-binding protein with PASTA domain